MAKSKSKQSISVTMSYADFVISAQRVNAKTIAVSVLSSPAGSLNKPVRVSFSDTEEKSIHQSFCYDNNTKGPGRMNINQAEATQLGKQLASVLFPSAIFKLFVQSLSSVIKGGKGGLRIRLSLDESLVNLPWEYLWRPDRKESDGLSGFLLLDPAISLVRQAANRRIALQPITGRQHLHFSGTFWEGNRDEWEVKKEFDLLKKGLAPAAQFITGNFSDAAKLTDRKPLPQETAIFHYAGHCDFDEDGTGYLVTSVPQNFAISRDKKIYAKELTALLRHTDCRLVVLSACNSGFRSIVEPLLNESMPAVIGINGVVASHSTIEFCSKLYESLAVGLSLDEAVDRARNHLLTWGSQAGFFDWGLYMVYMPSPESIIFPRKATQSTIHHQEVVRTEHGDSIKNTLQMARDMEGMNFGEIMSELSRRRVLILGRFSERRKNILKAIKQHLAAHPNKYLPELFTFKKPDNRDLVESILAFAGLSRFIIADISEPKSVPSELQVIVPNFLSIPVVPIINKTGKPYATFSSIERRQNVAKPLIRYTNLDDLLKNLEKEIIPKAETMIKEIAVSS